MIFLSGLLGMMALGSLALVTIGEDTDEDFEPSPETGDETDLALWPSGPARPTGTGPTVVDMMNRAAPTVTTAAGSEAYEQAATDVADHLSVETEEMLVSKNIGTHLDGGCCNDPIGLTDAGNHSAATGWHAVTGGRGLDGLMSNDVGIEERQANGLSGTAAVATALAKHQVDVGSNKHIWLSTVMQNIGKAAASNGGDEAPVAAKVGTGPVRTYPDVLPLGAWIVNETAQLLDFDGAEDQLMVVYNDAAHGEAPDVDMRINPKNPSLTEIMLGDRVLASLPTQDAPPIDAVVMIGERALAELGIAGIAARGFG